MKKYLFLTIATVALILVFVIGWGEYLRRSRGKLQRPSDFLPKRSVEALILPVDTYTEQRRLIKELDFTANDCSRFEELFDLAKRAKDFDTLQKWLSDNVHYEGDSVCVLLLRGEIERNKGNIKQAAKLFDEALARDPKNMDALQKSADLSFQRGNYERALVLGTNIIDMATKNQDERRLARASGNLAVVYSMKRSPDRALELQNQALTLHQNRNQIRDVIKDYFNRASILAQKKDYHSAAADYERALDLATENNLELFSISILKALSFMYKTMGEEQKAQEVLMKYQRFILALQQNFKNKNIASQVD
ncbi:tetratricopeptide repeat protein [candidate division CSSED10-310 bacterium]|uniref:Tetratricopeptide repeat protein n=1 Tax=candidate division CSSED10-310 bacterium TaxID=2855610 RepID=A0ABV6Z569_UNCC1